MQTSTASGRPSLTYRTTSTAAPTVDRGGPNRSNAASPRPTTGSTGASRKQHRPPADRVAESDDRPQAGSGSGIGSETRPPQHGPSPGRDAGRPQPRNPQPSSGGPSGRPSGRTTGHAPESDSHRGNRFDGVDVSSRTDPRFDADVDRAVQELYRKLERKIRIERERRGL
ncbi:hypothetical protein CP557_17895 [Natrinema ejinorense]|uniref:Uncharacterized protein n=1 Tax=Natrinema ejinorense TaxID=373386 RepID=A0A2A5QZE6_9EURY|nr:hypothetical protein CP557_17895 [Natrinema ejinorense]